MKFQSMMILVLAAVVWTGCAKEMREPEAPVQTEDQVQSEDPEELTTVQFTATIAPKETGKTKTVSADGATTWAVGEQIALYYQTNSSYSTATATVSSVDGSGVATITATLSNAKDAGTVEFVYPAIQHNGKGGISETNFLSQTGAIDGISEYFDLATGTGTLQVDNDGATLSASVTMENQILIGKFIPKNNGEAISGITRLTINDGSRTYTATASAGTFGTDGIYVAMLPVAQQEIVLMAETTSQKYGFGGKLITLEQDKLYNNLAIPMLKAYDLSAGSVSTTEEAFIYQSNPAVTTNTVTVGSGCKAIIHSLNYEYNQASGITCLGNATLVLSGSNVISSYSDGAYFNPAIKPGGSDTILMINGSGSLIATGGCLCAAIGGGYNYSCGSIYIDSGTITAVGGIDAPGIGSGRVLFNCPSISCGDICISGGSITAIGGEHAPGIGAGIGHTLGGTFTSTCGHITITDGITKLTAIRGAQALAPIGTGPTQSFCGTIEIDGTTSWSAGTPTDNYNFFQTTSANTNDTWTITKEASAENFAGGTISRTITIPNGGEYTLMNSTVSVSSGPAIKCEGDATITLIGSNTVSTSAYYYPAIQVGPSGKTLTIQASGSCSLNATGAFNAAGIGSPDYTIASSCGNIVITGGTITATGGENSAGIGGGNRSNIGQITISGGTVTASGTVGAGIGTGRSGICNGITISGGTVTATSNSSETSKSGAGIGSGMVVDNHYPSSCGPIVISGGTVQASGGPNAAGIGSLGFPDITYYYSGYRSGFESITITSDVTSVTATRGALEDGVSCDPIGHGSHNAGTDGGITIDGTLTKTDNTWTVVGKTTQYTGSYSSTIVLPDGADVTFSFVSANVNSGPAVLCEGDATITLVGGNNFYTSASTYPAIQAGPFGKTLTIKGSGSLTATGGEHAAGIGSGNAGSCGDITISGGTVIANGGESGAGIGSGRTGYCGDITISGGTMTARGGNKGAGIGSGDANSSCKTISISGGTLTATGGDCAAGIGSGGASADNLNSSCEDIIISGGTVTATGGSSAAGIGSGQNGTFSSINIASTITSLQATKGEGALAPVGKGYGDAGSGSVTIDGMTSWTAGVDLMHYTWDIYDNGSTWTFTTIPLERTISGTYSSTILLQDGSNVTFTNVTANVTSGPAVLCEGTATITLVGENTISTSAENCAGIQAGASGTTLTIQGSGSLTAIGGKYGAGIGSGDDGTCGDIIISGGTVNATGGDRGAGIGGGRSGKCGDITISGGTVNATGGYRGAGIGGGLHGNCGKINISGGTVTGTGGESGAGIGSGDGTGDGGTCGNITISGGTVTATGGDYATGIGSGDQSTCGNINISGGTVNATGGSGAAGIGTGQLGNCGDITISGGTVTATANYYSAGIGSGVHGKFSSITIGSGITSVTATMGSGAQAPIGMGNEDQGSGPVTIDGTTTWTAGTGTANLDWTVSTTTNTDDTWTLTWLRDRTISGTVSTTITLHDGANVTLDNVTAYVGGPVILCKGDATITLVGENTVYASADYCSGIQVGPSGKTLTIQGSGSLTATGGDNAAGIGSNDGTCGNITISGGTVTATGGDAGAGIGSGNGGTCGNITISGGTVTATGGLSSAGIGTGRQGTCGDIIISGGTVDATGGDDAAGIGSGFEGNCGDITIESTITSVTATMGWGAQAPIGRGLGDRASGTVTIDGVENPSLGASLTNLNWSITNSSNTWTLTKKSQN